VQGCTPARRFLFGVASRSARPTEQDVAEDLEQTIRENAAGPKRAQGDSGSVEQHAPSEQIEADRYLASKEAVKKPTKGLRFTKLVPPGTS
jgi:hypothetical protein